MSPPPDLNSFPQYLREVARYPLLTRDEERAHAQRWCEDEDREARDALVLHNLRFVISVAKEYKAPGIDLVDLVQAGNEGLLKAVNRFDPDRDVRLISYATYWIHQGIRAWLAEHSHVCRLPVNRGTEAHRIRRVRETLAKDLERRPTVEEVAEEADSTCAMVEVVGRLERPTSLDAPVGDDAHRKPLILGERIPAPEDLETDIETAAARERLRDTVEQVLSERLARIIFLENGLGSFRDHTLEEIGKHMGISRERVRQLRNQALDRLREKADPVVLEDCRATLMS